MSHFLFNELPVISSQGKYILFSPYTREKIIIDNKDYFSEELCNEINLLSPDFFQRPKEIVNDYLDRYNLVLSLTNDCNLRCTYCFVNGGHIKSRMTEELIEERIEESFKFIQNQDISNFQLSFFGGEPTLCIDLIRHAINFVNKQKPEDIKVSYSITTNGAFGKQVSDFIIENNIAVSLSMDGLPEVQNLQRPFENGAGSAKSVEKTITRLIKNNIYPKIRVTVTKVNCFHMPQIVKYLGNLGVKEIHFEPVTESGRGTNTPRPSREDFVSMLFEAIDIASDNNMKILNSAYARLFTPSVHYCDGMGDKRKIINYDGSVSSCVEVNDLNHEAKDYFMVDDLTTETLVKNNPISDANDDCKVCFMKYNCAGGCPSRNYHVSGDIYKPDPYRCYVVKHVVPKIIERM